MSGLNLNGFSKESKRLIGEYEQMGYVFRLSSKGHAVGATPDGQRCTVQRSMKNARSLRNAEAQLERARRHRSMDKTAEALTGGSSDPRAIFAALDDPASPQEAIIAGKLRKQIAEDEQKADEEIEAEVDALMEAAARSAEIRHHSATADAVVITDPLTKKLRILHYLCRKCDKAFDTARSVGQHSRTCDAQGNVPQTGRMPDGSPRLSREEVSRVKDPEPVKVEDAPRPAVEVVQAEHVDAIRLYEEAKRIIAPELHTRIGELEQENQRLHDKVRELHETLAALRELIGEVA